MFTPESVSTIPAKAKRSFKSIWAENKKREWEGILSAALSRSCPCGVTMQPFDVKGTFVYKLPLAFIIGPIVVLARMKPIVIYRRGQCGTVAKILGGDVLIASAICAACAGGVLAFAGLAWGDFHRRYRRSLRPATSAGPHRMFRRPKGHGMDVASLSRHFEPFFTTKEATSGAPSSGATD